MKKVYIYLLIAISGAIAYFHLSSTQFVGDDMDRISFMSKINSNDFSSFITSNLGDRPILMYLIYFNYKICGSDPVCYKLTSLFLHIIFGVLLFNFMLLFQNIFLQKQNLGITALFTILFMVHPLNSQTLLSSIQMGVILAGIGLLGCLLFFLKFLLNQKKIYYLLLSICFFTIGILSKPILLTAPVMFFVLMFNLDKINKKMALALTPFLLLSFIPFIFFFVADMNHQRYPETLPALNYFFAQLKIIFLYFKLFFLPVNLHFTYYFASDFGNFSILTIVAFAGHLTILIMGAIISRKIPYFFSILIIMYLCFIPESSFFPIRHLAFEHRTYVPNAFIIMAITYLAIFIAYHFNKFASTTIICATSLMALTGAVLTNQRLHQVDTTEKWMINDYYYQEKNIKNNQMMMLGMFYVQDKQMQKEIATTINAIPSTGEIKILYEIFLDLTFYDNLLPEMKKKSLEKVANYLLAIPIYALDITLVFLCQHLINQLPRFIDDEEVLFQKYEIVIRPYRQLLKENQLWIKVKEAFVPLLLRNIVLLERKSETPKFTDDDCDHYLLTLSYLVFLFPDTREQSLEKISRLRTLQPEFSSKIGDPKLLLN